MQIDIKGIETVTQAEYPSKCRDCKSFGAWMVYGFSEVVRSPMNSESGIDALKTCLQSLSARCAVPEEGSNCFAGDDMFGAMIESDFQLALDTIN